MAVLQRNPVLEFLRGRSLVEWDGVDQRRYRASSAKTTAITAAMTIVPYRALGPRGCIRVRRAPDMAVPVKQIERPARATLAVHPTSTVVALRLPPVLSYQPWVSSFLMRPAVRAILAKARDLRSNSIESATATSRLPTEKIGKKRR